MTLYFGKINALQQEVEVLRLINQNLEAALLRSTNTKINPPIFIQREDGSLTMKRALDNIARLEKEICGLRANLDQAQDEIADLEHLYAVSQRSLLK